MAPHGYPELDRLLNSYFHVDCLVFGDDEAAILADYVATSHAEEAARLRAEIELFLRDYAGGLNAAAARIFGLAEQGLGEDEAAARATLERYRDALP